MAGPEGGEKGVVAAYSAALNLVAGIQTIRIEFDGAATIDWLDLSQAVGSAFTLGTVNGIPNVSGYVGLIDDVRVYGRVLTDSEISTLSIATAGNFTQPGIGVEQQPGTALASGSSTVNFGAGLIGVAVPLTFTIKNAGSASLTFISESKDGANNADYVITTAPVTSLAVGESTTFKVVFTPSVAGTRVATLRISSNDPINNPFNINLTGTGVAIAPVIGMEQPVGTGLTSGISTVPFGSSQTGVAVPITFTIKNTGNTVLTGIAVTKDGTNAADFVVTALPPTSLAAGSTTTFEVTFTPSAVGTRVAALHIASNDLARNPFNMNLTGIGAVPVLVIEIPAGTGLASGSTLDFGSVVTGVAEPQAFAIKNTGSALLNSITVTVNQSGSNTSDFVITSPPVTSLAPGATSTFVVGFTPLVAGNRAATMQISSNDPVNNPFNVNLTGVGSSTITGTGTGTTSPKHC